MYILYICVFNYDLLSWSARVYPCTWVR